MSRMKRTPTRATGGITAKEKERMAAHAQLWIARAMRTDHIEPDKIIPAIKGIYAAANLKEPRVVIVPSPLVMAFAYGASAAIWQQRKGTRVATYAATYAATRDATRDATRVATRDATYAATRVATRDATYAATYAATDAATYAATRDATRVATRDATYAATYAATDAATYAATYAATRDATRDATYAATRDATDDATRKAVDEDMNDSEQRAHKACYALAGKLGLDFACRWRDVYQGGNMWAEYECYLTAARDILNLQLPAHANYAHWNNAAIHGGFRVMHEEFCLVSDFPEVLRVDSEDRPHCENGPSHKWRDGWALYHWHGVKVPANWIEDKASLTAEIALTWKNIEQRRAACEILGWSSILSALGAVIIDTNSDPEIGELIEVAIPDIGVERFLRVQCGTRREFALPVPPNMKNALEAQAWTWGLDTEDFTKPEVRT